MEGLVVPVHLAVHVLGLAVAAGLAVYGVVRREEAGPSRTGLVVGGVLLASSHLATGAGLVDAGVTWPIYARAGGYAALAVGAVGRLAGVGAVMVIASPGAHLAAAAAGLMAALATWRGVLGRGREVAPLAAGLVLWASADLTGAPGAGTVDDRVVAALSVVGSLAAGRWLMRRAGSSLLGRFVASSAAVLLVVVIGLASAAGVVFRLDLEQDARAALAERAAARSDEIAQQWTEELRVLASAITGDVQTANVLAVRDGRLDDVDAAASAMVRLAGVDAALVVDASGVVIGSHDATTAGRVALADETRLAGDEVVAGALAGSEAAAITVVGSPQTLAAVAAVPVAPREGTELRLDRRVGAIVLVRRADPTYVQQVAAQTGADASVVVVGDPRAVVSTLPGEGASLVAERVLDDADPRAVTLPDGREVFLSAAPVVRDRPIAYVALADDGSALADLEQDTARLLFWLALAGMLLAGGLAAVAARRTTAPITRLTRAAERIAAGDLDVRLSSDRDDEVGRLAGAFDEMTVALAERQQALREAAATEQGLRRRLEVVTGSMSEALLAVDRDGVVVTANPAASGLLGTSPVGRGVDEVLQGTDAGGRALLGVLGGADAAGAASVRGSVHVPGGRRVPVAATAAPLVGDDGRSLGRVYVLRDVAREVEVERMKTEFLSNISHELRTPLTPIKGYAEVMRSKEVSPERIRGFADKIAVSTERLERIIGMLVDFAALEAGRMRITLAPTELDGVVDHVLARWRTEHPGRRFSRRLARDLPSVRVDEGLLSRVLEELVDNAVKFSDGPVTIAAARDGDAVEVIVRDRGQGIEPEQLEAILADFHQGDGSATRRYGGLGLGLSIVRRIVDRFDADLEVRSEVGAGTEVLLRLMVASP
jgi:signal transduction histidine kinase